MLACLELPNLELKDLPIPKHHRQLIDKVVQHRSNAADASAGQPALITGSDIKAACAACWHVEGFATVVLNGLLTESE